MSAFMHSDKHIAFVVGYAKERIETFERYELAPMSLLELAQLLVDCNADNILDKYGDDYHHELTNIGALCAQVHEQIKAATLGQFVQAVRSLRYQSCDRDGYDDSEGAEWHKRLLVCAAEQIPGQDEDGPDNCNYWSID